MTIWSHIVCTLRPTYDSKKLTSTIRLLKLREGLEPITKVVSFFNGEKNSRSKLLLETGSSLLKIGSSAGIDFLLQKKLAKAGWLTKLVLPFVLRFAAAKTVDKVEHRT